jgi:hypothetical protein
MIEMFLHRVNIFILCFSQLLLTSIMSPNDIKAIKDDIGI